MWKSVWRHPCGLGVAGHLRRSRRPGAELSTLGVRGGRKAMLAWRVARGAWGPLRVAGRPPGARLGRGGSRRALLPPAACCLGCLAERWRLRPAAFALRLPGGAGPRNHCSGAGKAAPESAAGGGATAQAPGARWVPASAASPVRTRVGGAPGGRGRARRSVATLSRCSGKLRAGGAFGRREVRGAPAGYGLWPN